MYAQELLVHNSRKWKGAERIHACVVHPLRVFVLAFKFEGEVVGQMSAFVIPTQKPQGFWIPDLK